MSFMANSKGILLVGMVSAISSFWAADSLAQTAASPASAAAGNAMPPFMMPSGLAGPSSSDSPAVVSQPASSSVTPVSSAVSSQTALPSDDGVNPRAPGLQLSPDVNAANSYDPFAEESSGPTKTPEETQAEIRTRAYEAAMTGVLPLKPNEIRKLIETYDKTQQSVEVPLYPYPQPQVTVQTVSLDPGAVPPELKVATGHVSTLNIMDISGAPWPIQDVSWAGNFEIVQPESGGSVIRVTPMSEFAYGNMSIRLVGLTTPITFVLKTHRDMVQYRFDARIAEYGPNAKPPVIQGGMSMVSAGDPVMGAILDGQAPDGSTKLSVNGVDGRTTAYSYNSMTYVRTPLTLLSPGWMSSVSSGDGMNVYQMRNSPVLLLSDNGQMVRARLNEKDATP